MLLSVNSKKTVHPEARNVVRLMRSLSTEVSHLRFQPPVTHVYNPLDYARGSAEAYVRRFVPAKCQWLFVGMNPGPWGMAQTGVPFGEVKTVRDWMQISGTISKPVPEHPKRPVLGFRCPRSEISGARLWGWVRERFGTPERFFQHHFVWNYCPLSFMEEGGKNRTPDKLPTTERQPLFTACDASLRALCDVLQPDQILGVGRFARLRAEAALGTHYPIHEIPHPSPANPRANQGWGMLVDQRLRTLSLSD